ncbi:prepilin-type N-terminal cleavage/methylation domain-containing protein [Synechococcales cyanobacterium C]|uniref:Prepilin-type N-terminal cleavage/methylation domain-containing protein n=1 Tax=Petrachloros mirabilis ULC683 TaxID=2781853 RepID=A0A8K1ZYW9_9CYAN|nr:type IV pilin-like G/H family protein [Petrachloros mirabilis]NCJ07875.1 prepilin-type N-terminal cleavage/methylation domain-containing protein [Petrachloros mirabilis ULC683]
MKTSFQAKYIQSLLNKKKNNEGFTLVELLVVVIIIGILAAIALPSFLNQTAKAKQAEARNTLSAVNSAQTAYRTEHSRFAASMAALSLGLPEQTDNYVYAVGAGANGSVNESITTAAAEDDALKGYISGIKRYTTAQTNPTTTISQSESVISSVTCEAEIAGTVVPVVDAIGFGAANGTVAPTCAGTWIRVGGEAPAAAAT